MAVIVSKQFKENFEIAVRRWLREGQSPEDIDGLRGAIRIDLADGPGFLRDERNMIPDPDERRKLWADYFQGIADEEAELERTASTLAEGMNDRIVKRNLTEKKKK